MGEVKQKKPNQATKETTRKQRKLLNKRKQRNGKQSKQEEAETNQGI